MMLTKKGAKKAAKKAQERAEYLSEDEREKLRIRHKARRTGRTKAEVWDAEWHHAYLRDIQNLDAEDRAEHDELIKRLQKEDRKAKRAAHLEMRRLLRVQLEFGAVVELGDQWVAKGTNWVLRLPNRKVIHFGDRETAIKAWDEGYRAVFESRASRHKSPLSEPENRLQESDLDNHNQALASQDVTARAV